MAPGSPHLQHGAQVQPAAGAVAHGGGQGRGAAAHQAVAAAGGGAAGGGGVAAKVQFLQGFKGVWGSKMFIERVIKSLKCL